MYPLEGTLPHSLRPLEGILLHPRRSLCTSIKPIRGWPSAVNGTEPNLKVCDDDVTWIWPQSTVPLFRFRGCPTPRFMSHLCVFYLPPQGRVNRTQRYRHWNGTSSTESWREGKVGCSRDGCNVLHRRLKSTIHQRLSAAAAEPEGWAGVWATLNPDRADLPAPGLSSDRQQHRSMQRNNATFMLAYSRFVSAVYQFNSFPSPSVKFIIIFHPSMWKDSAAVGKSTHKPRRDSPLGCVCTVVFCVGAVTISAGHSECVGRSGQFDEVCSACFCSIFFSGKYIEVNGMQARM